MIASVGSSIRGSGDVLTCTSSLPCQVSAFMACSFALRRRRGFDQHRERAHRRTCQTPGLARWCAGPTPAARRSVRSAHGHQYDLVPRSAAQVFEALSDGWVYSNWVVGTSHMRAVEAHWPVVGSRLFQCLGRVAVGSPGTRPRCSSANRRPGWCSTRRPSRSVRRRSPWNCPTRRRLPCGSHRDPSAGPGRWLHNPASEALSRFAATLRRWPGCRAGRAADDRATAGFRERPVSRR